MTERRPYRLTRLPGADSSTSGTRASYDAMLLGEIRRRAAEAVLAREREAWSRLVGELEARSSVR